MKFRVGHMVKFSEPMLVGYEKRFGKIIKIHKGGFFVRIKIDTHMDEDPRTIDISRNYITEIVCWAGRIRSK